MRAVHIEADGFSAGEFTFYHRYVGASAIDHREPLGTQYSVRHLLAGSFDSGTKIFAWRDTGTAEAEPLECAEVPSWYGTDGTPAPAGIAQ